MKKIIVPVDFSEHSEYALAAAAELATQFEAEILAVHMLEMSNTMLIRNNSQAHTESVFFLKLAEQKFETFLDKPYLKDIKITPIVKHFKVFSELNELVKEHGADLIIMGSHGVHGLKELFIGSNTERVVRTASVPVLVVKEQLPSIQFKKLVFASNFATEDLEAFRKAEAFSKLIGGKLYPVYINTPSQFESTIEIDNQIKSFLIKADGNLDRLKEVAHYSDYNVERGTFNYAAQVDADILAISTHARKGLSHFLYGSIGEDIANHATLPVITFHIN
ncbi:universal stress protein [Aquimarina rhabdastrellae]